MKLGTVFYEDSGEPNNYGLHVLALTVVAERQRPTLNADARVLQRLYLVANPRNGDSKLLPSVRDAANSTQQPIVGVFDFDKLHRLVGLPAMASQAECVARVRETVGAAPKLVLIDPNIEVIFEVCCGLLGRSSLERKPKPWERDKVLHATAKDLRLALKLFDEQPSFRQLVEQLEAAVLQMHAARAATQTDR